MTSRSLARRAAAALAFLLAVAPLAGCGSTLLSTDGQLTGPTITIGIAYDQPSMAFERSGEMSGVDADVAVYVASRLGYAAHQISWRQVGASDSGELLNDGDVNIIVGAPRTGDGGDVTYSAPYIHADQRLMVRGTDAASITGVADLKSRQVCTVEGHVDQATSDALAASGARTMSVGAYSECVTALISGSADAVAGEGMVLAGFERNMGSEYLHMVDGALSTVDWGVALPAGDSSLRGFVDDALQRMADDGTWGRSVEANFSGSSYTVDSALVPGQG